jgi:hypothetical protein
MHRELLLIAFIQAGFETGSRDRGQLAQQVSGVLRAHGEACEVQALLDCHLRARAGEALHLKATLSHALSRYLGYEDYADFLWGYDEEIAKLPEALLRTKVVVTAVGVGLIMLLAFGGIWVMEHLQLRTGPMKKYHSREVRSEESTQRGQRFQTADPDASLQPRERDPLNSYAFFREEGPET